VVLVMGKGGVGKTTVAAALAALTAEARGLSVLVEFGDGESGRRALHGARRGVEHVVIRPAEAIQRGATPLFGSATLARLALGNFAMRPLLRAAPAVRELAMLESVRQVAAERPGVRVIVDMPATGHSVAWLRVPKQGRALLGEGPLYEMCDRVGRELIAPGKASIVVVTLPEKLVLEETLELCAALEKEASLAVDRVVVNRVPVPVAPASLADARALADRGGPLAAPAAELHRVLSARSAARAEAVAALESLAHEGRALWQLPLAPVDPSAKDVARWLRAEGAG
jgi:arsenite-transporting ATPase